VRNAAWLVVLPRLRLYVWCAFAVCVCECVCVCVCVCILCVCVCASAASGSLSSDAWKAAWEALVLTLIGDECDRDSVVTGAVILDKVRSSCAVCADLLPASSQCCRAGALRRVQSSTCRVPGTVSSPRSTRRRTCV
jgi:hypothetical protein